MRQEKKVEKFKDRRAFTDKGIEGRLETVVNFLGASNAQTYCLRITMIRGKVAEGRREDGSRRENASRGDEPDKMA